jgi:flagellar basal body-associated protein FliL
MSEAKNLPAGKPANESMDATAALQELEDQLEGGSKDSPVSAAAAVAAAAATITSKPLVQAPIKSAAPEPPKPKVEEPAPRKKAKARRTFFEGGPSRTVAAIRNKIQELVRALGSPDRPTRKGARLFFASVVGLALVTAVAGHRYWGHIKDLRARAARITRQQKAVLAEFLRMRSEIAKRKNSTLLLGGFNVALQPDSGSRTPSSSYRLAEIEVVVECESKETRDFLEENIERARNEVTNTFVNVDRQELMSQEGKARLKRALQERLNLLLPKGHVESIFFSKMVLT